MCVCVFHLSGLSARVNPSSPLQARTTRTHRPLPVLLSPAMERSDYRACRRSSQPLHFCLSAHNTPTATMLFSPQIQSKGGLRAAYVACVCVWVFLTHHAVSRCLSRLVCVPSLAHRAKTFIGSSKMSVDMSVLLAGEVEVAGGNW